MRIRTARRQADSIPATGHTVRVHAALAAAALLTHTDRQFRLWVLARSLDVAGRGMVLAGDLQTYVADVAGLTSRQSVNRLLLAGDGRYWRLDGRSVWLFGLARVCAELDVKRISAPVVTSMPVKLKHWRSLLLWAGFAGDRLRVCSQRRLAEATGCTDRTIRNRRKAAASWLSVQYNAAPVRSWARGDDVPAGCYVDKLDGAGLVLFRALPCSYKAGLVLAGRGNTRRINSGLLPRDLRAAGFRKRLFFDDRKAATTSKAYQAMREGDVLFLDLHTCNRSGSHLWQERRYHNGKLWQGGSGAFFSD